MEVLFCLLEFSFLFFMICILWVCCFGIFVLFKILYNLWNGDDIGIFEFS